MLRCDAHAYQRLRAAVVTRTPTEGLLQADVDALAALRVEADSLLTARGKDASDAFCGICGRVWDRLAMLDEYTNMYALPPRYMSDNLRDELAWAADNLRALERGQRPVGDHAIFTGTKGVGKTTFLQAIGAIAAVLLTRTIPIYHSYEQPAAADDMDTAYSAATLASLLLDAAHAAGAPVATDGVCAASDALRALRTARPADGLYAPLLLLDEFTELYHADSVSVKITAARMRGQMIMRELHWMGKTETNTWLLLAASRTRVEVYMYPERSGARGLRGYPHFNNSVFIRHNVRPIRDAAALATGGVGCFVASFLMSARVRHHIDVSVILSSPHLFAVYCRILATATPELLAQPHWPPLGVPYTDVLSLLESRGMDAELACSVIDGWCDDMVLHRSEGMLQVLVPATLRELKLKMDSSDDVHADVLQL